MAAVDRGSGELMITASCHDSQRGMALVIVLWITTLLAIMAASFGYSMRAETRLAVHGVERAKARAFAEAGVNYAAMQVLYAKEPSQEPVNRLWNWTFGSSQVRIQVMDASGRIDLNAADRNLLKGLLQFAGVEEDSLDSLVDAIEDWRDADDQRRVNGAEQADYEAAGLEWGPKNAPFDSIEELQQVLGITSVIYRTIREGITVHSRQSGINPATAPALVLKALPDVDPAVVENYIEQRRESLEQQLPLPPPPPGSSAHLSNARGIAYHVSVEARVGDDVVFPVEAVIASKQRPDQVFALLAWREN